jgi:hypothetical protein
MRNVFLLIVTAIFATPIFAQDNVKVIIKYYGSVISSPEVADCKNEIEKIKSRASIVEQNLGLTPGSIKTDYQIDLGDDFGDPSYTCSAVINTSDNTKKPTLINVSKYVGKKNKDKCDASFNETTVQNDVVHAYQSNYLSFSLRNTCKVYAVKIVDNK